MYAAVCSLSPVACESQINNVISLLVGNLHALIFARRSDSSQTRPGGFSSGLCVPGQVGAVITGVGSLSLGGYNRIERTLQAAQQAAVTTVHIDKRGLIAIETNDRLYPAYLLR
jgi:hypothetical protein